MAYSWWINQMVLLHTKIENPLHNYDGPVWNKIPFEITNYNLYSDPENRHDWLIVLSFIKCISSVFDLSPFSRRV